jgi:hypothetical protein
LVDLSSGKGLVLARSGRVGEDRVIVKKSPLEDDLARLKKKVRAARSRSENPEGDAAIRTLRKRLKRAQRKRRSLAMRKKHAMGKKAGAGAKAEGS